MDASGPGELLGTNILVIDGTGYFSTAVSTALEGEIGNTLTRLRMTEDGRLPSLKHIQADVVLVGSDIPELPSVVEQLDATFPTATIAVLFEETQPQLARECMLAGARLCLDNYRTGERLINCVRRIRQNDQRRRQRLTSEAETGRSNVEGKIIAIHGPKGGVGTSTVAANLAIGLRQVTQKAVCIFDGNLSSGDQAILMGIVSEYTLRDLMPHMRNLNAGILGEILATHSSGVRVLLAPTELEQAEAVTGEQILQVLTALRKTFDYIVIDTASMLGQTTVATLDAADTIIVVCTPEIPALRDTARFMQITQPFGYAPEKVMLCINRIGSRGSVTQQQIELNLKRKVSATIPSDGHVLLCSNHGEIIIQSMPDSLVSKAVKRLAMQVSATDDTLVLQGATKQQQLNLTGNAQLDAALIQAGSWLRNQVTRSIQPRRR